MSLKIRKWWRRNQDLFILVLEIILWLAGVILFAILYILNLIEIVTLIEFIIVLILGGFIILLNWIQKKEQVLLIGFISKYLLERDEN